MTHPLIMLSTLGGMACMAWAVRLQVLRDRKARSLREWVRNQYPQAWNAVPGWIRKWATPIIPMSMLARRRLVSDPAFSERYAELHRLNRRMGGWAILGLGVLCVGIIGSRVWGWQW